MDSLGIRDDRARHLPALLAWRALRRSITRGKVMSLPNLLRLHQRHCGDAGIRLADERALRDRELLTRNYRRAQPFPARTLPRLLY